ncbi:MAG: mandelate racemase/muconate lactonizing enzyme family protein [Deltaproteobacteria bacterium]|nr:mandelate racemase/muconate lactonizing enzyme family protein [Deltaproteobacteria bacterium]
MQITRIELWRVAVPLPAPFYPSWIPGFEQQENRFDLIRLVTASGLEGWSAAQCMSSERSGLGSLLGNYLLGERADDIANIRQRVREMSYLGWRVGWIEAACWDIVGKARGKPIYQLLGGEPLESVRGYASTGQVRSGAERVKEVEARLSEGFEGVKLRVHAETLEEDLEQLEVTRKGVGDAAILGVDANQAWRVAAIGDAPLWDEARALAFCRGAEAQGFTWVEEPLAMDDYAAQARLREATEIAITGGELNNQGLPEFGVMIGRGCYDWYQPDAVFTGGIAETWAIIQAIDHGGAAYSPHTWTNGVGFAINLQLFAASRWREEKLLEYPYDPPGWVPEGRDGILVEPWSAEKGRIPVPDGPGLGIEIDGRALRRHGTRYFVGTAGRVALNAVLDRGLGLAKRLGATRQARLEARRRALEANPGDPALEEVERLVRFAHSMLPTDGR